jgi:hypothetical protein
MGHYSLTASDIYQSDKCSLFVTGNCDGTIYFNEIVNRGPQQQEEDDDLITAVEVGKMNLANAFSKQVSRAEKYISI